MKQYGHIPATQPSAQTADGGRRSPMTDIAALPARENPYKNTAKNLCMCGFCIYTHTHSTATRVKIRKILWGTMPYTLFSSSCKADPLPFYSLLTLYRHAYVRI